MTKNFYNAIKTQIETFIPEMYVRLYRSQFEEIEDGESYSFGFPCCFIEFISEENIKQLGNDIQLFDPLIVRVYIGSLEYDSSDGFMDQNTSIMDLKERVYLALQKFEPSKASLFIRVDEKMHSEHKQISVFTQDYKTTLIDSTAYENRGDKETTPTTNLDLTVTFE